MRFVSLWERESFYDLISTLTELMNALLSPTTSDWLLAHAYDPLHLNQPGSNGDTALMRATREGAIALVNDLIAAGADVNCRNNDGNNALWFACFGNHFDLMPILIAAQINLDNQNDNGATALMYAASAGKTAVVQTLLAAGADPTLTNLDDFRAIDFASSLDILRILKHAAN